MLGGQHIWANGRPRLVKPGVFRCVDCERTHCYAVRGPYMDKLIRRWAGGGRLKGNGHCDWIMGRDPDLQRRHKVYAPELFLVGQERTRSDINGRMTPRQFWNPPGPELAVINLHAPQPVVAALREHGLHTGYDREPGSDLDRGLVKIFSLDGIKAGTRKTLLREWIKVIQWEVASDPRLICTVWHPRATAKLVRAASLWPVCEITAKSVDEVLRQLPAELRRAHIPGLAQDGQISMAPVGSTGMHDRAILLMP
jgi:hypothetical protein